MENSAVNTGSPVRRSETVEEERPVSATFWSAKVTHVLRIARKTITPQAAGSIVATSITDSAASAAASDSTNAMRICVPAIVGADSFSRPFSPNTSDPAMAAEESSESASPAPNENEPPLQHKRYSPPTTATWKGIIARG